MALRIAVQMDPIDTIVVDRDTSLAFMVEAQKRGHETFWYHPSDLWWETGKVFAHAHRVDVTRNGDQYYRTLSSGPVDAATFEQLRGRQSVLSKAWLAAVATLGLLYWQALQAA